MEASLTCAVCLSLFEDPVTLPVCSHNFCRSCVVECLRRARNAAESSLPSFSSVRSRDLPRETSWVSSLRSQNGESVGVACPLCRKLCLLPSNGAADALPVNTTLAEVVKLFKAVNPVKPSPGTEAEATSSAALIPQLAALGVECQKHPGRPLQLYCRMCRRGGCGQCVSEDHCGVFHSVNLIDTVYQEEKLAFFSNLKKIRELQLKLMKKMTVLPKDSKFLALMQKEEEMIKTEFEKLCNALETRKKELLEDLELQKKRNEKECLIWKNMKEANRKSIENVLSDCEKVLDEGDPQHFLQVACGLNQKMKNQLELVEIASRHENQPEYKQMQLDTTSIIKDILGLNLTEINLGAVKGIPSGNSESSMCTSPEYRCEDRRTVQDVFCPMVREDTLIRGRTIPTQYMSLSATTEFQNMSHEELRYMHYMKHEEHSDELQAQTSSVNRRNTLPKPCSSKSAVSGTGLFCLGAEANRQKKSKMQVLQRQSVNRSNFSDSLGFVFKAQILNFNFCDLNSKTNVLNTKKSQNDPEKTSLLERTGSCLGSEKLLPAHAETCPQPAFPNVSPTAVSCEFGLKSLWTGVTEPLAPPLFSNSNANLTVSVLNKSASPSPSKKSVLPTSFLENFKSKDCNIRDKISGTSSPIPSTVAAANTTTTSISLEPSLTVAGNPFLSDLSSENDCFQITTVNNSKQTSVPRNDFSNNDAQVGNIPSVYPFTEDFRNSCKTLTSSTLPFKNTGYAADKSEINSKAKNAVVKKPAFKYKPVYQKQKDIVCHSSLFSMETCLKSETDSIEVPQQNVTCDSSVSNIAVSIKNNEDNNVLENQLLADENHESPSLPNETNCRVHSDSDVKESQMSS